MQLPFRCNSASILLTSARRLNHRSNQLPCERQRIAAIARVDWLRRGRGGETHLSRKEGPLGGETATSLEAVFTMRGITKVYHMGEVDVHALRGVDLDLYRGEFVVLLGPSGSGKSTLLNILGGLDSPSSGTVHYRDRELTDFDDAGLTRYRRNHVGFVFQFYNLIPSLTAREKRRFDHRNCQQSDAP